MSTTRWYMIGRLPSVKFSQDVFACAVDTSVGASGTLVIARLALPACVVAVADAPEVVAFDREAGKGIVQARTR